jgi:hypothetical protein
MSTYTDITQIQADKDHYRLVRKRSFTPNHEELVQVLLQLKAEKVTGTMTINFSGGGINRAQLLEEQDIHY